MSLRSWFAALTRNVFHRDRVERDLNDELDAYVASVSTEKSRGGLSPAEAARAAAVENRGLESVKEQVRDVRAGERLDLIRRDLVFAARTLRKTPGFTIAAVLALALGIGATTAMLSVVNGVLLRPLPYADADRLVVILFKDRNPVSPQNFVDWRSQTRSFAELAAAEYWTPNLMGVEQPEKIDGLRLTAGMLPMLGVSPMLGRFFTAAEDTPGNEHVAVIGYGLWQRRFAGDSGIIGRTVLLDGERTTIIGVMPSTFQFAPFWATRAELWAPRAFDAATIANGGNSLRLFARLKPGISLQQARADLATVTARLDQQSPGSNRNATVQSLKTKVVGDVQTALLVLLVAVAFVLLIACANVAHMLLARAASRQRELGIRTALGATRGRLIGQMLVESVVLAVIGGLGGLLLAELGVRTLIAASPSSIPRVATVTIDLRVLLMTIGITAVTAIAFGLVPALRAAQVNLAETFRDGDRASSEGGGRARLRSVLVASEFALALVLLVGAGLMIRTFNALQHIDPGFDPRNVVTMAVSVTGTREADSTVRSAFYTEALTRIRAIPGVESASWINHVPIGGDLWGFSFAVVGQPKPKPGEVPNAAYRVVFPGYFRTMHASLLRGRDFTDADRVGAPKVVVINDYMAKRYWPGLDAIGKRILMDTSAITIVGVVKNMVREDWAAPAEEEFFFPYAQQHNYTGGDGSHFSYMTLVARAVCDAGRTCDAAALTAPIVNVVRGIDRNIPISGVSTMDALVSEATGDTRLYLALLGAFAIIAIVLASVGIYGVMSYSVARRTHEIGIRIALGAEPRGVLGMIVKQGMTVAVIGATAGVVVALGLTTLMSGLLYGVAPRDPVTFVGVIGVLCGVAFVASYVPARRATRIDPLAALRSD
ncbi:MAG: ABC transporter permease [Gemmatimonadaceae bacterium]